MQDFEATWGHCNKWKQKMKVAICETSSKLCLRHETRLTDITKIATIAKIFEILMDWLDYVINPKYVIKADEDLVFVETSGDGATVVVKKSIFGEKNSDFTHSR